MCISELNGKQLDELRQAYLIQLDDCGELKEITGLDVLSQDALMDAGRFVTDSMLQEHYKDIDFSEDDFFCTARRTRLYD